LLIGFEEVLVEEEKAFEVCLCEMGGVVFGCLRIEVRGVCGEEVDLSVVVEFFELQLVHCLRTAPFFSLRHMRHTSLALRSCRCIAIQFYSNLESLLMKGNYYPSSGD
jgi:hypothetical protein